MTMDMVRITAVDTEVMTTAAITTRVAAAMEVERQLADMVVEQEDTVSVVLTFLVKQLKEHFV